MDTFIQDLAKKIITNHNDFSQLSIVLPSKRAVGFLRKELILQLSQHKEVGILPVIIDIEQFISELSGLRPIDATESMLMFYKAYLSVPEKQPKKDFESFSSWGQTLLQDFNEIDRYLVDHDTFFNYLYLINDQKHWFLQENKTDLVENYIHLWEQLKHYYKAFVDLITEKGVGFQGLQYRRAANAIENHLETQNTFFVFAGFNALNNAEQHIIKTCISKEKGTAIWDADTFFMEQPHHDTSYFLRKYKRQWNIDNLFTDDLHNSYSQEKSLYLTGVAKNFAQVKHVSQLLSEMPKQDLDKTAIILADESLLLPMLTSIPKNVEQVNITMGLPFATLPIVSLIPQLIALQQNNKAEGFYYKEVNAVLDHYIVEQILGVEKCNWWKNQIITKNWVYISPKAFNDIPVLETIFKKSFDLKDFNKQLIILFDTALASYITEEKTNDTSIDYCKRILTILEELEHILNTYSEVVSFRSYEELYHQKINTQQIDFMGNPHEGLQIMGVLESRCLDFETVIFVGVNEGKLPAGKKGTSFIPYDLKVSMALPTYKEKDAIFAYHFYRALQRCKTAHLIYNTVVDDMNGGEKSRFIHQLELLPHPNHQCIQQTLSIAPSPPANEVQSISKDDYIIEKLKALFAYGISPSALATYLRDPIQFYERYVLGVKEVDDIEEEAAANTQGTVIHNVLENFYKPYENKILLAQDIKQMLLKLNDAVIEEFHSVYGKSNVDTGRNYIIIQVAQTYLNKFLKAELRSIEAGNEIQIVAIESDFNTEVPLQNLDFPVKIKGKVDRIDRLNGQLRVIDYKTGKVEASKLKIYDWSLLRTDETFSKALQLLMYAYMYQETYQPISAIQAGIISLKKLNEGVLYFGTKESARARNVEHDITLDTFEYFLKEFEQLILEITNSEIPFSNEEIENA